MGDTSKNLRCFFFGAIYNIVGQTRSGNFGTKREKFPTILDLKEMILGFAFARDATDIVILSITELSEEDYDTLFSKQNSYEEDSNLQN